MSRKPVLGWRSFGYQHVSESEIDVGVAYARDEYKKKVDRDLLRVLVNTTLERRNPATKLPFLAAAVVRDSIPLSNKQEAPKYEAYKGAIMKIMSERSVKKRRADAQKRARGVPTMERPKQTEHPEDPKRKGQLLLL